MPDILSFPVQDLLWQPPNSLPDCHDVITLLRHFEGTRPDKLVLARNSQFGPQVNDDRGNRCEISHNWTIVGWLKSGTEIDLLPAEAASATVRPLKWTELSDGTQMAPNGLGGHYVITHKKDRTSVYLETEERIYIGLALEATPETLAQEHHDAMIKASLGG